jgi:hypothetical protein
MAATNRRAAHITVDPCLIRYLTRYFTRSP